MSQKTKRNTTNVRLSFYTHAVLNNKIDVFDVFDYPGLTARKPTSLVSVAYTDTLESPAGSLQIQLKPWKESFDFALRQGKLWTDLIQQGDWWLIEVLKNDKTIELSFGIIDVVGSSTSMGSSKTTTVNVTGRSFGFGLQDTPIFFNPYDPNIDNAAGVNMIQVLNKVAGTPDQIVTALIRGFMGGASKPVVLGGYIEVPRGIAPGATSKPWISFLDDTPVFLGGGVQEQLRGNTLVTALINPSSGGSVWDMVKSYSNPTLNEVFIDTSPVKPTPVSFPTAKLIVREKPFENLVEGPSSPWFRLTTWEVDARLLTGVSLSRGHNKINYIMLSGDLKPVVQDNALGVYLPVANMKSIKRYGLHRLEETTSYFDGEGASIANPTNQPQPPMSLQYREWLFLLVSWNLLNHRYWMGTIDIGEMRPEIRKGEKIRLSNAHVADIPGFPRELQLRGLDTTFYVEAVQHNWSANGTARTSLQLSRGFQEDLRLVAMAEEAVDWAMVSTIPADSANNPVAKLGLLDQVQQLIIDKYVNFVIPEPITIDGVVIE